MTSFKILIITIKTSTRLGFCLFFVNKDKGKMKESGEEASSDF